MAKKINILPLEDIELCFDNDKVITLNFGMKSLMYLSELGLDEADVMSTTYGGSIAELCASIVYAGAKAKNEDFTMEEANNVVACLNLDNAQMIIELFGESLGEKAKEQQREMLKNLTSQFLAKHVK